PGGEPITGAYVTRRFFALLGVQPALGRTFTADEQQGTGPGVVLLSYGLWQRRFGGDSGVVGRTMILDGEPATIIGVLPASFGFPSGASVWRPFFGLPTSGGKTWTTFFVRVLGRLAPGVGMTQARTELTGLLAHAKFSPPFIRDAAVDVMTLHERLYGSSRPLLLILLGAVGFLLLIACANVASLLVARAAVREREFAIRAALGAGRRRLMRQLLAESMVLAILGAGAGLVVPALGLRLFMQAAPLRALQGVDVHLDAVVLAFTTGLAVLTGVAFGVAPALAASHPSLVEGLKSGAGQAGVSAHRARLREGLVVTELAAALVLLMGAGLLTRSLFTLLAVDLGFSPGHVVGVHLGRLSSYKYRQGPAGTVFYAAVLDRLAALPGVASAALADVLPLEGVARTGTVRIDDAAPATDGSGDAALGAVSPEYFKTLGVPVVRGRPFTSADRADSAPVAIVNSAFGRRFLSGGDPVGHRVEAGGARRTIVGETKDVLQMGRDASATPQVLVPASQAGYTPGAIAIRANLDPERLVEPVRRAIREVDADAADARVFTLESELAKSAAPQRESALLLGAFATVALVLAAVGLAGVMAYLVAHRTHEIGVRVALGAGRGDVLRLVVLEGARLVVVGAGIGVIAAVAVTRVLKNLLFGVTATDPLTFVVVPLLLAAVALGAAVVPARRAMKVDPMVALRHE
ncbi:MAG TPA: ABC transporter permease, partial [Gemmatimonadales bacterium]|nr:ABC transporter permease [Gemmatimonadales bacterium]